MAEKAQIVEEGHPKSSLKLEPVDGWPAEFLAILGSIEEEIERPPQTPVTQLENPFA